MTYISREAFLADKRKQYCADCDRRKGMKNGKLKFCYEIGEAPCRACRIDDVLDDVEDYPAADVRPVTTCDACVWHVDNGYHYCNKWCAPCPDNAEFFCAYGERHPTAALT